MSALEAQVNSALPKGSSKTTELHVAGLSVKVRTDSTPLVLKQIRDVVESKIDAIERLPSRKLPPEQLCVLVAHQLAEDLLQERERLKVLKRRMLESLERLVNRVESRLDRVE